MLHFFFVIGSTDRSVVAAAKKLSVNEVIAVPTDTIYGIAGLAQSSEAVEKIYDIKCRSLKNPISISVADVEDVYRYD